MLLSGMHVGNSNYSEVLEIWIDKVGDNPAGLSKVFDKTKSRIAYDRMWAGVKGFSSAMRLWNNAGSDSRLDLWKAGFQHIMKFIGCACDGLEIMAKVPGEALLKCRIDTIKRTIEVIKTEDDVLRLIRGIKDPDWEVRALLILKLAEFYITA